MSEPIENVVRLSNIPALKLEKEVAPMNGVPDARAGPKRSHPARRNSREAARNFRLATEYYLVCLIQAPFEYVFLALEQCKGRLTEGQPDCRVDHSKRRFAAGKKGPAMGATGARSVHQNQCSAGRAPSTCLSISNAHESLKSNHTATQNSLFST